MTSEEMGQRGQKRIGENLVEKGLTDSNEQNWI